MEQWREVVDNPNYLVSNTGRVRRNGSNKDKAVRDRKGYLVTDLYMNGKRKTERINRLVASAFVDNPGNKEVVDHLDENKHNNNASNLEWVTHSENIKRAWNSGAMHASCGMKGHSNPNAGRKGKPFKIVETGEIFNTLHECESKINGNNRHINDCLKGRQKSHRGYHFEYI